MFVTQLPQFDNLLINIGLFRDVNNAKDLRSQVTTLPYGLIDASMILSIEQLLSAIYKAIIEAKFNKMRTKTLYSECILSLSPSSNISDALLKFGIKDDTKNLIVVKIFDKNEKWNEEELFSLVDGTYFTFTNEHLLESANQKIIKTLNDFKFDNISDLSDAIVHAIQLRGL